MLGRGSRQPLILICNEIRPRRTKAHLMSPAGILSNPLRLKLSSGEVCLLQCDNGCFGSGTVLVTIWIISSTRKTTGWHRSYIGATWPLTSYLYSHNGINREFIQQCTTEAWIALCLFKHDLKIKKKHLFAVQKCKSSHYSTPSVFTQLLYVHQLNSLSLALNRKVKVGFIANGSGGLY